MIPMTDGPPPDDFDYGERRDDGQYEDHPTTDEGEFEQPVRQRYDHVDGDCDGGTTRMGMDIAESFARDPTQYGKTFCSSCGDYHPLTEFVWTGTDVRIDTVGEVEEEDIVSSTSGGKVR